MKKPYQLVSAVALFAIGFLSYVAIFQLAKLTQNTHAISITVVIPGADVKISDRGTTEKYEHTFQVQSKTDLGSFFCNNPNNTAFCYGLVEATDGSIYRLNFAGKYSEANYHTFELLLEEEWYTCIVRPDLQTDADNDFYIVSACQTANRSSQEAYILET